MSALEGVNITSKSNETDWYDGPSLMDYLETVPVGDRRLNTPFRMPVQWVNRPNLDFRGFSGQIAAGSIQPGDRVKSMPSGKQSTVQRIVTATGDLEQAIAGQSVTITLDDEIDCSRGDVLVSAEDPSEVSDQFQARLLWISETPLLPGRRYLLKMGAKTVTATVNAPKYGIDVNTLNDVPAKTLELNQIGVTTLSLDQAIPYDPYDVNREMGGFILIDRMTNDTVGLGLVDFALRRASNIHWQAMDVDLSLIHISEPTRPY